MVKSCSSISPLRILKMSLNTKTRIQMATMMATAAVERMVSTSLRNRKYATYERKYATYERKYATYGRKYAT